MVDDLLVIPDIEGAKLNLHIEPVNIDEMINGRLFAHCGKDEREIIYKPDMNLSAILADKDRLEQILINLIDNACKYSYENSPIKIELSVDKHKGVIKVINEADYMSHEVLNRLFGKFIRLDDKTTRTTRGTGLGLFIVKGLVLAMNGSIELDSTQDNTFISTVKFPLA
jgi:signal transduction histidine kinase